MSSYGAFLASKRSTVHEVGQDASVPVHPSVSEFRTEHGVAPNARLAYIYALCDPRTGRIRYIGKSVHPLTRLRAHARRQTEDHRGHWVAELGRAGLEPVLTVLDAVPADSDWQLIERAYIAGARDAQVDLTNSTDGGDGVPSLPPETRERIRLASVGRVRSEEARARMSAAQRRRTGPRSARWRAAMTAMRGREVTWGQKISAALHKLTDQQVRDIRAALAAGESQYVIADRFGIHQGSVSNLARGKTYRDVP